jgi:hypothetical protein
MDMNIKSAKLLTTLGWCLFIGIVGISVGLGAAFPSINLIAKPVLCPSGEMKPEATIYRPTPAETMVTIDWYCVNAGTAQKTELSLFPISLIAGTFYGALLFPAALAYMYIAGQRKPSPEPVEAGFKPYKGDPSERAARIKARLEGLERLRQQNKISDAEYKKRRTQILEDN